jgi:molybdenum cofactor guanylyltransferase
MRVSAVLLAGGRSSRMGRDKALLDFDGEPLWKRQLHTLRRLRPEEIFISGWSRKEWEDYEVIADEVLDAGPLAGVAASLHRCSTSHLIVLAIDLPRMTANYLSSLLALAAEGEGVVPVSTRGFEPLAALYPQRCRQIAQDCLEDGDYSMQCFLRKVCARGWLRAQPVLPNEVEFFTNLNTVADYEGTLPGAGSQSR